MVQRLIGCRCVRNQGCDLAWLDKAFCIFTRDTSLSKASNTRAGPISQRRRTQLRSLKNAVRERRGMKARPARSKHSLLPYIHSQTNLLSNGTKGGSSRFRTLDELLLLYKTSTISYAKLYPSSVDFGCRSFAVRSSQQLVSSFRQGLILSYQFFYMDLDQLCLEILSKRHGVVLQSSQEDF